ncbi:MAG: 2-C-methyl-D-erythritol 2,4-cyclodiphosphate synthase [Ruminococcaceae bacterium]|nr:2-C-methyl-D-erythritol 2,4-cyclodiphosphate synthase [Oscillospiraceae bacterium]
MTIRIGHGYDLHRCTVGRPFILGGVDIPFEKGLLGHSDADCLLHAITDAILGGAALPDIGRLFPDTDEAYRGADSALFLKEAQAKADEKGYRIGNIDATVICQRPKLAPHIDTIRARIAEILSLSVDQVNVKAKTAEGLGDIGRGEAVECHAVCLLFAH